MAKKPKHKTEAVVLANSIKTIGKMVHIEKINLLFCIYFKNLSVPLWRTRIVIFLISLFILFVERIDDKFIVLSYLYSPNYDNLNWKHERQDHDSN